MNDLTCLRFLDSQRCLQRFPLGLIATGLIVLSLLSRGFAQSPSPTLAETIEWLKGEAHAVKTINEPPQSVTNLNSVPVHWEIVYSGGCILAWRNVRPDPKSYPQMSVSFSLADLNPQKVNVANPPRYLEGSGTSITLNATGGKRVFSWHITTVGQIYDRGGIFSAPGTKTKKENSTALDNHLVFRIADSELAQRIGKDLNMRLHRVAENLILRNRSNFQAVQQIVVREHRNLF